MRKAQERAHTQAGEVLQNQRLVRGRVTVYLHVCTCTVEPRHHWEPSNCPDCRGVLNSGVVLYKITTIGTKASVHIREVSTVRGSTVHVMIKPYFKIFYSTGNASTILLVNSKLHVPVFYFYGVSVCYSCYMYIRYILGYYQCIHNYT